MVRVHMVTTTVEVRGSSVPLIQHSPRLTSQAHTTSMTHCLMYLSSVHLVNFCRMCNKPYISSSFIKQLWQSVSLNLYSCYTPHSEQWRLIRPHAAPLSFTTSLLYSFAILMICSPLSGAKWPKSPLLDLGPAEWGVWLHRTPWTTLCSESRDTREQNIWNKRPRKRDSVEIKVTKKCCSTVWKWS